MSTYAPIALFVFKRLSHLKILIRSLEQNHESTLSDLYIFSDAARNENDKQDVNEVRAFIKKIKNFKSIKVFEQKENLGLANSIISGVSQILESHEKVIVLEDDLALSPYFLYFMNEALEKYSSNHQVFSISGYSYPLKPKPKNNFFIRGAECWGWATWKRAWQYFEENGQLLLESLKSRNLLDEFNLEGSYPYSKMLENQIKGKNDSWAIRFHASSFLHDGLTLFPRQSLVNNLGNDGSGTHCEPTNAFESDLEIEKIEMTDIPIQENRSQRNLLIKFYRSQTKPITKLKLIFRRFLKCFSKPTLPQV